MFVDARQNLDDVPDTVDICVVGAGIAGLILARRLSGSGLKVWLVESGGHSRDTAAQSLNAGQSNVVDYPFIGSRARVFGGTSTRWTGACVALDPADFEARSWIPHSGWPVSWQELQPHLDEARKDFGISATEAFQANLNRSPLGQGDLEAKPVSYSAPLNLGKRYHALIAQSQEIHCLLNATVTELFPCPSGTRIESLEVASPGRPARRITPRMVVLASGGIENARLLLSSNSVQPGGVGNAHDVVGRYHMEHPIRTVGVLPVGTRGAELLCYTNVTRSPGGDVQGTFGLSRAARDREQLLDLHIRCYRYSPFEDRDAIISGKKAASRTAPLDLANRLRAGCRAMRPVTLGYLAWHTRNKLWRHARFDQLRLMAFVEQEPDPENRISLSNQRDAFGRQLPYLRFGESAAMRDSVRRTMQVMDKALSQAGFPGLRHDPADLSHLQDYDAYGLHQMGSTRMAADPRRGVVDKDCRVHGLSNLYIAGSSVFPTGGAANPSWTIGALSLRLADEISRSFRQT